MHAELRVDIEYGEDGPTFEFHAEKDAAAGVKLWDDTPDDAPDPAKPCPAWIKGLRVYKRALEQKGLVMQWAVTFLHSCGEYCRRYNLVILNTIDCTNGGLERFVPNSQCDQLNMRMRFSNKTWPKK